MRLEELEKEVVHTEDLMSRVGINVLRLRLERGWTQTELGWRARTDQGRIAHIEGGDVNLTLRRVAGLARAFGMDPVELIRDPGTVPRPRKHRLRHVSLEFEWYAEKARSNIAKHGITFEEATTVFGDPLSTTIPDPDHSLGEQRYFTLGMSDRNRLVVVWFAERDDALRIIGARQATPRERKDYEKRE